jgi:mRNA interferase YafQ
MLLLVANDAPLGPEWRDHPLKGEWASYRERHVGGDFLLIYKLDETSRAGSIVFVRTGSHSELFGERPNDRARRDLRFGSEGGPGVAAFSPAR